MPPARRAKPEAVGGQRNSVVNSAREQTEEARPLNVDDADREEKAAAVEALTLTAKIISKLLKFIILYFVEEKGLVGSVVCGDFFETSFLCRRSQGGDN